MASIGRLKSLLLILLQLTKLLLLHDSLTLPHVSSYSTNSNSILTNQLPRFNIPPGNLSYFRNPYWEVLYLLKFKTLPFHSSTSSSINRPLLQRIKSFLGSDRSNYYNREDSSNSNFFISDGDSAEAFRDHEVSPVKKTQKSSRRSTVVRVRKFPRNSVAPKYNKRFPQPAAYIIDEFDEYNNQKGNRVGVNFDDRRNGGGGGINGNLKSLRPSSGESGLDMPINKKVNRKFQTQGWK